MSLELKEILVKCALRFSIAFFYGCCVGEVIQGVAHKDVPRFLFGYCVLTVLVFIRVGFLQDWPKVPKTFREEEHRL